MLPSVSKQSSIKQPVPEPQEQDCIITGVEEPEPSPKHKVAAKNYQVYVI